MGIGVADDAVGGGQGRIQGRERRCGRRQSHERYGDERKTGPGKPTPARSTSASPALCSTANNPRHKSPHLSQRGALSLAKGGG